MLVDSASTAETLRLPTEYTVPMTASTTMKAITSSIAPSPRGRRASPPSCGKQHEDLDQQQPLSDQADRLLSSRRHVRDQHANRDAGDERQVDRHLRMMRAMVPESL